MKLTVKQISIILSTVVFSLLVNTEVGAQQSAKNKSKVTAEQSSLRITKAYSLNEMGRFISGLPVDTASGLYSLTQTSEWKSYKKDVDSAWIKFNRMSDNIKAWKNTQISATNDSIQTLFYPFGGPDYLFANIFFPNANNYILMGLESPGNAAKIEISKAAELKTELNLYKKAIEDVIQLSFFRTNDMKKELKTKTIDGTAPIIMLFLARSGKEILEVTPMNLNKEGQLIPKTQTSKGSDAVVIAFKNPKENITRHIIYLSTNVADPSLSKNAAFMKYLSNIDPQVYSFIKSATYLMHKPYFSIIRNTVLDKSVLILQDDSGIGYKFFKKNNWDISLYGTYEKPIELFNEFYEADLFDAYKKNSKPITFRYGYNRKSNLLLAQKKPKSLVDKQ